MGLKYKISDKELLEIRNNLFKESGISGLLANGFELDPFKTSWHGEYDKSIQAYIYQFSRIDQEKYLERIEVYIIRGEKWIQIFLNIFELNPDVSSLQLLKHFEGIKFGTVPNIGTKMRLRSDDYKGPPILHMFSPEYKLGGSYTKSGFQKEVDKLKELIKSDMNNINDFIKRWHELFVPNRTDWEGNILKKDVKKSE